MGGFIYEIEGVTVKIPKKSFEDTHGVSLCCIILNEEKGIEEFLLYHKPYFKEIIMIDLGSTDKTLAISAPIVDEILSYKQDGHHSNALNRMMEKVNNDWVFLIDCDERVEIDTLKKLDLLIEQEEFDCYSFPRKNFIDGKVDEQHPVDYQDRLFRSYCRMVRPVHQEIVGFKSKEVLPEVDGNYIIHSKHMDRHNIRNNGYILYEYKFRNEMGGPGNQTKDNFYNTYPQLTWDSVSKKVGM